MSNLHHQEKVTQKTFSLKWLLKTVIVIPWDRFFSKVDDIRNCKFPTSPAGCFQKFEFMDVLQLAFDLWAIWRSGWFYWYGNKDSLGPLEVLLMEEILQQLMSSLSHYLKGFLNPRWCRISSIKSMFNMRNQMYVNLHFIQKSSILQPTLQQTNITVENPPLSWYIPC